MNNSWIVAVACFLLALVIGAAAWLAWPTGRAFSFLNDQRPTYRIQQLQNLEGLKAGKRTKPVPVNWTATIQELKRGIGAQGYVYSAPLSSMQDTLRYGKRIAPNTGFVTAIGQYRQARDLTLVAGRDPGVNAPEIVVSEEVAQQLTDRPTALIGKIVTRNEQTWNEHFTVTGIVRPSVWRSNFEDPDAGGYKIVDPSKPGLSEMEALLFQKDLLPSFTIVFREAPTTQTVQWLRDHTKTQLPGLTFTDMRAQEQTDPDNQAILARLRQRAQSLPLLAALLGISGLLSLCALTLAGLLRRRTLLGVELTLGARRSMLLLEMLARQVLPGALGALVGTLAVFALPRLLPGILVGTPPPAVLGLAFLLPPLGLALLTVLLGWGVLRESPLALLRGVRPGQFVRPLLGLMLVALTLSLGGVLSAMGVKERLDAQVRRVTEDFGRILALNTGGDADSRKTDGSANVTSRRLTAEDAAWLSEQPGVQAAVIGERINGGFRAGGKTYFANRMMTGDAGLLDVLGIGLVAGKPGGCLLTPDFARSSNLNVGDTMELPADGKFLPCPVTGLMTSPDPLQRFVLLDFPEVIVPSEVGLVGVQGPLPGMEDRAPRQVGGPLRTTRLLLRLDQDAAPDLIRDLKARVQDRYPQLTFSLRPYAPSITLLLERLQLQSRVFLILAGAASLMTLFGLLGGFLAYLDATRYRLALDRTQGLSLRALRVGWALGGLGLGVIAAGLALGIATVMTPSLYNAFSLDAPVGMARDLLPAASVTLPGPLTLGLGVLATLLLSLAVMQLGVRWLGRQSLITLLKAGS